MSVNTILVIVGAVLILVGLAKAGQSGGFSLSNIGINFGGTNTQTNKAILPLPEDKQTRGAHGRKHHLVRAGDVRPSLARSRG